MTEGGSAQPGAPPGPAGITHGIAVEKGDGGALPVAAAADRARKRSSSSCALVLPCDGAAGLVSLRLPPGLVALAISCLLRSIGDQQLNTSHQRRRAVILTTRMVTVAPGFVVMMHSLI